MASPNAVFTELVSTTFRKHSKEIKDNISNNNALLRRIYDNGGYRKEDGGLTIVTPLDYAANNTYQRYSGYDVLNIGASDVISSAEYQWRQIAVNVVASGMELRVNSGGSRIVNLVKARMKNAIRTFKNNFSVDVYSDGTLPNQINGLQALVSDAGTGTVGGIDSSTWTFWKSQVQSAAAPLQGGGGAGSEPRGNLVRIGVLEQALHLLTLGQQVGRGDAAVRGEPVLDDIRGLVQGHDSQSTVNGLNCGVPAA